MSCRIHCMSNRKSRKSRKSRDSRNSRNSRNSREGIDRSYSMLVIIHYKYEVQVGVGEEAGERGRRKEGKGRKEGEVD